MGKQARQTGGEWPATRLYYSADDLHIPRISTPYSHVAW